MRALNDKSSVYTSNEDFNDMNENRMTTIDGNARTKRCVSVRYCFRLKHFSRMWKHSCESITVARASIRNASTLYNAKRYRACDALQSGELREWPCVNGRAHYANAIGFIVGTPLKGAVYHLLSKVMNWNN